MTMLPAAKQVSSVQSLPYCLFMRLYGTWSELELYDDDNDNDFFLLCMMLSFEKWNRPNQKTRLYNTNK